MDAIQRRGKPSALPNNLHPGKDRKLQSQHFDRPATPDSEQDLLFRTHLAVAAGVLVANAAIVQTIFGNVGTNKKRNPAHTDAPNLSCHAKRICTVNGPPLLCQAKEKSLKVMVRIRLLLPGGDIQMLRSSSPTPRAGSPDGWPISDDRRASAPRPRAITNRRSVNANSAGVRVGPERPHHLLRLPFEPDPGLPALVPGCTVDSHSQAWQARDYVEGTNGRHSCT